MNWLLLTLLLALLASVAVAGEPEAPPPVLPDLPTYDCHQAAQPPVLDGLLDDPCWAGIPAIRLCRCISGTGATQATTVKVIWHGDYLYTAWRVREFDVQDHNQNRNDSVFGEACVEHFLQAPGGFPPQGDSPNRYCEVDLSPTGVIWDGRVDNPYGFPPDYTKGLKLVVDPAWDPPDIKCASKLYGTLNDPSDTDHGWTMEVQIPLAGPPGGKTPEIGEVWRMNLYRIHGWTKPDQELQAWSVVGIGNFHVPQRFGMLRFVGPLER